MNLKRKSLIVILLASFVWIFFRSCNVQAATFVSTDDDKYEDYYEGRFVVVTENGKTTFTDNGEENYSKRIFEFTTLEEVIGINSEGYMVMKQSNINNYINSKEVPYTAKYKIDNSITSLETVDGKPITIETIGNERYAVITGTIHYDPNPNDLYNISDYKNKDVEFAIGYSEDINYYKNGDKSSTDKFNCEFRIISEHVAYERKYYGPGSDPYIYFVNSRGVEYSCDLGFGGGSPGGAVLFNKLPTGVTTDDDDYNYNKYLIPANKNLDEVYLKISFSAYQGESIELGYNKGTIYYEGREGDYYIYKNKLSNLSLKSNERTTITYKTKTGYELTQYMRLCYKLTEDAIEEVIEVDESTVKNKSDIGSQIGINFYGNAKFDSVEINKDDTLYKKVQNSIKDKNTKYKNSLYFSVTDIYLVSGNYGGKLDITFNVGNEYNGKPYYISHYIGLGTFEYFEGVVKNGKISITVDSLSPFGVQIFDEEVKEKDDTPKTGTINYIYYLIPVTLISLFGAIILKRKEQN